MSERRAEWPRSGVLTVEQIRLGMPLPALSRQWNLKAFVERHELVYGPGRIMEEAWPERNIHSDAEAAQREGLPAPVISAPQIFSMVHRSMFLTFGIGWIAGGKIDLKMIRPVYPDEFTTVKGEVVSISLETDADGHRRTRVECAVRVDKLNGEVCCAGRASALVD